MHFTIGGGFDPYTLAYNLVESKVPIFIGNDAVEVSGDLSLLSKEEMDALLNQQVMGMKNTPSFDFYNQTNLEERTHIRSPKPFYVSNDKKEYKQWEVWLVDFAEPYGQEFGYLHYAVLGTTDAKGLVRVYPCTSQFHLGNTVYALNFNQETLYGEDYYLERFKDRITYVLCHMVDHVDVTKLVRKVGTLQPSVIAEIEKCIQADTDNQLASSKKVTKVVSSALYSISRLQEKILNAPDRLANINAISKNSEMPYETKITSLMNIFGFYDVEDGKYLFSFVKAAKEMSFVRVEEVMKEVSKGKLLKSEVIQQKIVELVYKRFKIEEDDKVNLLCEFVQLINKLAGSII